MFGQGDFLIDPTATTPEQIARNRRLFEAMMKPGQVRYAGEGAMKGLAAAIGGFGIGRDNKRETAGRNEFRDMLRETLFGGSAGGSGGGYGSYNGGTGGATASSRAPVAPNPGFDFTSGMMIDDPALTFGANPQAATDTIDVQADPLMRNYGLRSGSSSVQPDPLMQPYGLSFPSGQTRPGVNTGAIGGVDDFRMSGIPAATGPLQVHASTRNEFNPRDGLNISMDFNAAPGGGARGTEVIIPDNATPEVRAAAERYNQMVAEFAAANGYADYPIRGVRTRSENGRGVGNTIHTEPFFNDDLQMQRLIQENPEAFASIYREAFGGIDGRLIAPHGVGNDRGAASPVFGNETDYGMLMANSLLSAQTGDPQLSFGPTENRDLISPQYAALTNPPLETTASTRTPTAASAGGGINWVEVQGPNGPMWVSSDFLRDESGNYVRGSAELAAQMAEQYGGRLPQTPGEVDAIAGAAGQQVPFIASGQFAGPGIYPGDMPHDEMVRLHNEALAGYEVGDGLVDGPLKTIMANGGIYHPEIQPFGVPHSGDYADYSQGIRLVRDTPPDGSTPAATAPVTASTQNRSEPPPRPSAGGQLAQAGGGMNDASMAQLYELMLNPWASPQDRAVIGGMIEQRMQASDPMRQLQMEQLRLQVEQMRDPNATTNLPASAQVLAWQAEQAGLVPGTPEYQDFMMNGGGDPATFRALDMQAQAAGFVPGTPEYADFMATRGSGIQSYASRTGTLTADIERGGTAAEIEAAGAERGQATVQAGVEAWQGSRQLRNTLGTYDDAIAALDAGAGAGVVYNRLPRVDLEGATLQNAMDRLGLDVVGSVTFGALSENELRLAMQTAVPRNLNAEDLRTWLERRRVAVERSAAMLEDAAAFLTTPGNTIDQWIEQNRSGQSATGRFEEQRSPEATEARPDPLPPPMWADLPEGTRQALREAHTPQELADFFEDYTQ